MIADHRADHVGQQDKRSDIKARLPRSPAVDFALAFEHDDALQPRPVMAFLPLYIVDHRIGSGFDAAMIAVDRLVPADCRILETIGFLLLCEEFDIVAQRSLIALE